MIVESERSLTIRRRCFFWGKKEGVQGDNLAIQGEKGIILCL